MPSIDALVDSASGSKVLSFLDAFSGYNQIKMHPRDESKTAFMTETCSYCYKVMPFGLKNAGATYQRLMDKVLAPMLGRNVYAYEDDMVVASQNRGQHMADLEELFNTISKYRLKLNPEKCVFGVEACKFLGFLLTERGIQPNPDKCTAIIAMRSPTSVKEVPRIVWVYHTTPQSSTMETPFSLVYGSDAMIPVEIHESSPRFQNFVVEESNEERRVNLDLLEEAREEARIKAKATKRRVERQYSSKVKPR